MKPVSHVEELQGPSVDRWQRVKTEAEAHTGLWRARRWLGFPWAVALSVLSGCAGSMFIPPETETCESSSECGLNMICKESGCQQSPGPCS